MKPRIPIVLATALLAVALPAVARGQTSSASYKLTGVVGSGGTSTSASYQLWSGTYPGVGRSTSATYDLFPGFRGLAWASPMTERYPTQAKRYELVAFPLRHATSTVASILGELGGYDDRNWRFGHWNPATGAYQEPTSGLTTIAQGLGYWLITDGARNDIVDVSNPPNEWLTYGFNGDYPLVSGPGGAAAWNQLGNPYPFPINVDQIWVTDNFATFFGSIVTPSNTLTEQVAKVWNPATRTYSNATVINGRQGFWLKKLQNVDMVLWYVPRSSASGAPMPSHAVPLRELAPASARPATRWSVALVGRQGERATEPMVVGAADVESDEWNALCLSQAPAPPGGEMLTMTMPRAGWRGLSGDYTTVFSPAAERMSWDFVLRGAEHPGEITLDVTAAGLPAGARLWLTDRTSGAVRELAAPGSTTLAAFAGAREYRLEVTSGGEAPVVVVPEAGFVRAYPNPFRAASGLTFSLSRAGDVGVEIFDLQGRRVRELSRAGLSPGEHVLVWNGADDQGRPAGAGVFLARWRAEGRSGVTRLVRID